ncbi:putative Atu domain protein [Burkholderia pseudomallei MSHR2451]|nr:putative Atu domain protein [Burkholderia pseudomallei MSHR2451]
MRRRVLTVRRVVFIEGFRRRRAALVTRWAVTRSRLNGAAEPWLNEFFVKRCSGLGRRPPAGAPGGRDGGRDGGRWLRRRGAARREGARAGSGALCGSAGERRVRCAWQRGAMWRRDGMPMRFQRRWRGNSMHRRSREIAKPCGCCGGHGAAGTSGAEKRRSGEAEKRRSGEAEKRRSGEAEKRFPLQASPAQARRPRRGRPASPAAQRFAALAPEPSAPAPGASASLSRLVSRAPQRCASAAQVIS